MSAGTLLQDGVSPAYVQKQAGHQSMDMTVNVYGHLLPDGRGADVNRLDDARSAWAAGLPVELALPAPIVRFWPLSWVRLDAMGRRIT